MLGTIIFAVVGFVLYVVISIGVENGKLTAGEKFKVWGFACLIYFGLLFYFSPWDNKKELTEEQIAQNQEDEAYSNALVDCGAFVRSSVRLPDSIDWQYSSTGKGKDSNGDYLVTREFIAENSFGGRVRSRAVCTHNGRELLEAAIIGM